jgi:hypothetical protein
MRILITGGAEINAWGTAIVLEEAARARVKKLILIYVKDVVAANAFFTLKSQVTGSSTSLGVE